MYTIILCTGERLSSLELKNKERLNKLTDIELDILSYLQEDIERLGIKKIREEKWNKKGEIK
jgi:hypothetical protein